MKKSPVVPPTEVIAFDSERQRANGRALISYPFTFGRDQLVTLTHKCRSPSLFDPGLEFSYDHKYDY
eukprot:2404555-Rhodomonas_salina.1